MQSGAGAPASNGFKTVVETCVVKRCLVNALSPALLPFQKERLLDYVASCSALASYLARRASLILLHHAVSARERGQRIDDLSEKKDAFWKQCLRAGLDEYGNAFPSKAIESDFRTIAHLVGTTIPPRVGPVPTDFDRVLGHVGIQFKTAFMNNQVVPFFPKLQRLCKAFVAADRFANPGSKVHGFELFNAIRTGEPLDDPEVSSDVRDFVAEARAVMNLAVGETLYDDAAMDFGVRLDANFWMQDWFAVLGRRMNVMSPVFKVARMHVRLDATSMFALARHVLSPLEPECGRTAKPTTKSHPDAAERKAANAEYRRLKPQLDEYKRRYEAFAAEFPSYGDLAKNKPNDPVKALNERLPALTIGSRPRGMDAQSWAVERERRRAARDDRARERERVRSSERFQEELRAYEAYESRIHEFGSRVFRPLKDKSARAGWYPSMSIVTDGVSVCVTYERKKLVPLDSAPKKTRKRRRAKEETPESADPAYDPDMPTVSDEAVVAGLDPGRTHIATVVVVAEDGKRHVRRLSRGQYYVESGILRENARQARRLAGLDLSVLAEAGGGLRTRRSRDVVAYLAAEQALRDAWWDVALRRCESRSRMQRYIGKRAVLDRFFASLKSSLRRAFGERRIEIAYGSAAQSMTSTGRGEVAAPVGDAYSACVRAFGAANVATVWEYNTTKVNWNTGRKYEKVFKTYGPDGKESLVHTAAKMTPRVTGDDSRHVRACRERASAKAVRRRGGQGRDVARRSGKEGSYPVCRGLQFCTERRMFFDRDESSARAIAGLRCLERNGLGRPAAFRPSKKNESAEVPNGMRPAEGVSDRESRTHARE